MEFVKGKINYNKRVLIYGVEGVGKSTLSSLFPNPLIIDTEDRTRHLNINRVIVKDFKEIVNLLLTFDKIMTDMKMNVNTIVIDTLDWLQKLAMDYVCKTRRGDSIEDFGYGKGYVYVFEEMRRIVNILDALNKKYTIVCVCHCQLKKYEDPFGTTYDRYTLKLLSGEKTSVADIFKEWSDYILFMNYKVNKNKDIVKDERYIFTERTSRFDAKKSDNIPDEIPFVLNSKEITNLITTLSNNANNRQANI